MSMRRPLYVRTVGGVMLVMMASFLVLIVVMREPRYEGKTASEWLDKAANDREHLQVYGEVFLQWGEAGAIFLVRRLNAGSSVFSQRLLALYIRLTEHLPLPEIRSARDFPDQRLVRQLLGFFGEDAAPTLVKALHRSSGEGRAEIIRAMGELGPGAADIVGPHLVPLMNDPVPAVAYESITTLAVVGYDPDRVVPLLIPILQHTNQRFRVEASYALGSYPSMPEVTLDALVSSLKDPFKTVRANSIRALGRMEDIAASSAPQVIECLDDETLVKGRSIEVLPLIADARLFVANTRYLEAIETFPVDGYFYERMMVCRAKAKLGMPAHDMEEVGEFLLNSHANWHVWEAVDALAELDPRPDWASALLAEAAQHPHGLVRAKARRALGP